MEDNYMEDEENFSVTAIPPSYALKMNDFLREACKLGHLTCIEVLVGKGADVNYVDKTDKTTVLQVAITNGHTNIVEYLLDKVDEKTLKAAHTYIVEKQSKLDEALKIFSKKGVHVESSGKASTASTATNTPTPVTSPAPTPTLSLPQAALSPRIKTEEANSEKGKISSVEYENQIHLLTKAKDEIQTNYDTYKKQTTEIIDGLHAQVEKLTDQLKSEREINQETRDLLTHLGRELSLSKDQEIAPVKGEKDTEKRAKEIAKMILSVDNMRLPPMVVHRNPLMDFDESTLAVAGKSKSNVDLTNFNIQGKGNTPPSSGSMSAPRKKQEGSKDDIEIQSSDGVKYRVKRLVKRWEEIPFESKQ